MAPKIKEYHFHTYYFQDNGERKKNAFQFYTDIKSLNEKGTFVAVVGTFNENPVGPHPIGSFETWVPQESFAEAYSWFLLHRGELSVLIHPLTQEELLDHTDRVSWIGEPMPLDTSVLAKIIRHPAQYPELHLGYSAPEYTEKPIMAADVVLFSHDQEVLLIQRKYEPFQGQWALPGGHVEKDERLHEAATRELEEETGVYVPLTSEDQVGTFGNPGRDPRGWTVSVAFSACVEKSAFDPTAASDAVKTEWFPLNNLPELAFDHKDIIAKAWSRC